MAKKPKTAKAAKSVDSIVHADDSRKNIPTAEYQSVVDKSAQEAIRVAYERRNRDLDPQLVWRGKDEQDARDLVVHAPPLYIQEKVHPQALIQDLLRESQSRDGAQNPEQINLFGDFNGIPEGADKTEFYQHDQNWTNRMILGDSLQAMASLAEREGLRGKVQCIYFDPPYGIKFNSNFQWSTTSRDVKDGDIRHITREPEQVKAFRDTWRDGIHSYLTYLRDRLTLARDLLSESGSIFVQIGDENVHRVRALMDEVFGDENFVSMITFKKSSSATERFLASTSDYIIWFGKQARQLKYRAVRNLRALDGEGASAYRLNEDLPGHWRTLSADEFNDAIRHPENYRILRLQILTSQRQGRDNSVSGAMSFPIDFQGRQFRPSGGRGWTTTRAGIDRLVRADRIGRSGASINYKRYLADAPSFPLYNIWDDTQSGSGMAKTYVVQTTSKVIERCVLMSTDPGDLVLDPTCGSGTTASVAEQWGRRWITIDTSRVALALARSRVMGARYPYYLLADSIEGQRRESELSRRAPSTQPVRGSIRHGFVYDRVPHITLKSIANNAEIDVVWEQFQARLEPLRAELNRTLTQGWEEWEIPREAEATWPAAIKLTHTRWWELRIARQREIDASIAARADSEFLYDKPHEDKKVVRVAGPFTVESVSPHRVLGVDENDELIDPLRKPGIKYGAGDAQTFVQMILDNLGTAGVQQAHKDGRIEFTSLTPWPGAFVCAQGKYQEGGTEKRAAVFIGPEFGTVTRPDLVTAAREAGDADFDVLIACAFNYDAHASEFAKLGRIPVLKARMNADLHMADDLKNTGKGNLFVIFGEPDITILTDGDDRIRVKVNGVDVFHPNTGKVSSDGPDGIACWFVDTDYNEESFFVRHAYFLGQNDPYSALKTTLKAEIDAEAWATLNSDTSRPFDKPKSGRLAVKVINHLGDEVMKVFRVE
jgi:adenine-specific DNA-methyltransferase